MTTLLVEELPLSEQIAMELARADKLLARAATVLAAHRAPTHSFNADAPAGLAPSGQAGAAGSYLEKVA